MDLEGPLCPGVPNERSSRAFGEEYPYASAVASGLLVQRQMTGWLKCLNHLAFVSGALFTPPGLRITTL